MRKIDFFYDADIDSWRYTGSRTYPSAEEAAHAALKANKNQINAYLQMGDASSAYLAQQNLNKLEDKIRNSLNAIERAKSIYVNHYDFFHTGSGYITSRELPIDTPKGKKSFPKGSDGAETTSRGKGYYLVFSQPTPNDGNSWDDDRSLYSIYEQALENNLIMDFFKDIPGSINDEEIKDVVTNLLILTGE